MFRILRLQPRTRNQTPIRDGPAPPWLHISQKVPPPCALRLVVHHLRADSRADPITPNEHVARCTRAVPELESERRRRGTAATAAAGGDSGIAGTGTPPRLCVGILFEFFAEVNVL